jgi:predicted cobalt transporter CbtA
MIGYKALLKSKGVWGNLGVIAVALASLLGVTPEVLDQANQNVTWIVTGVLGLLGLVGRVVARTRLVWRQGPSVVIKDLVERPGSENGTR